jgi:hypothetical protein
MKIDIQINEFSPSDPVRVGNVYPIKGGRGIREKHMQILIAMSEAREYHGIHCLMLVVTKEGKPIGVNDYALHYVEELQPIAFVDGLEDMTLVMRSL